MTAPRLIVFCFDALDRDFIGDNYENLRLVTSGKTDISEFELPRSVILWSSFLTSRNMEVHLKDMLYEFQLGIITLRIPPHIGDRFERQIWGGWGGKILGKLAPLRKYLKERIWRIRLRRARENDVEQVLYLKKQVYEDDPDEKIRHPRGHLSYNLM